MVELGASIIWEHNLLLARLTRELGLKQRFLGARPGSQGHVASTSSTSSSSSSEGATSSTSSAGSGSASASSSNSVASEDAGSDGFAIWDGSKFVLNRTSEGWAADAALALRYGVAPLVYAKHVMQVGWAVSLVAATMEIMYMLVRSGGGSTHPLSHGTAVTAAALGQPACSYHHTFLAGTAGPLHAAVQSPGAGRGVGAPSGHAAAAGSVGPDPEALR